MFRCPRSAIYVAVPFSPDLASDPNTYEYVACSACSQSHLLNKSTGKLLGGLAGDVHDPLEENVTGADARLDVLCPNCCATGELREIDNAASAFRVYAYPEGFSEVRSSADYRETAVRCNCGQEFYLL